MSGTSMSGAPILDTELSIFTNIERPTTRSALIGKDYSFCSPGAFIAFMAFMAFIAFIDFLVAETRLKSSKPQTGPKLQPSATTIREEWVQLSA